MKKVRRIHNNVDDKGVAPVVGFLLIVAILFIGAAQYQSNVVPSQELDEEVEHFDTVQQDVTELRSAIIGSSTSGQRDTQEIKTGVDYDVLGITEPPVRGNLVSTEYENEIIIANGLNRGEASNFWRGDVARSYTTGSISYQVDYNRLQEHPDQVKVEHGYQYDRYIRGEDIDDDVYIQQSKQPIIQNRSITLYTMQGNTTASSTGSSLMEIEPRSAPMNTVSITADEGDNYLEIGLPTDLPVEHWEEVLQSQMVPTSGASSNTNVYIEDIVTPDQAENSVFNTDVNYDPSDQESINEENYVVLQLDGSATYNLQMSRVDLSSSDQITKSPPREAQYVALTTRTINVREGEQIGLEAQARDKYNNGVIGERVVAEARDDSTGECIGDFGGDNSGTASSLNCVNLENYDQPGYDISNDAGEVNYLYQAPEESEDNEITFSFRLID